VGNADTASEYALVLCQFEKDAKSIESNGGALDRP